MKKRPKKMVPPAQPAEDTQKSIPPKRRKTMSPRNRKPSKRQINTVHAYTQGNYVTIKQFAEYFCLTNRHVRDQIAYKNLNAILISHQWRIPLAEIKRVEKNGLPPIPGRM